MVDTTPVLEQYFLNCGVLVWMDIVNAVNMYIVWSDIVGIELFSLGVDFFNLKKLLEHTIYKMAIPML